MHLLSILTWKQVLCEVASLGMNFTTPAPTSVAAAHIYNLYELANKSILWLAQNK